MCRVHCKRSTFCGDFLIKEVKHDGFKILLQDKSEFGNMPTQDVWMCGQDNIFQVSLLLRKEKNEKETYHSCFETQREMSPEVQNRGISSP